MTAPEVIALLTGPNQDVKKLLRRCWLIIAGGAAPLPPNGQADIATFTVTPEPLTTVKGFTTGLSGLMGLEKDRIKVKILKLGGPAKVVLAANEFNAYYIPMAVTKDVIAHSSHYTLPTVGGALDVVITSGLSGCTFGVGSDGHGAVLVSHVKPDVTTKNLAQRAHNLDYAVNVGFHDVTGKFRAGHEYAGKGAVVGRRSGQHWKFYLQPSAEDRNRNDIVVMSKLEVIR